MREKESTTSCNVLLQDKKSIRFKANLELENYQNYGVSIQMLIKIFTTRTSKKNTETSDGM